jgi:hypothetical protein
MMRFTEAEYAAEPKWPPPQNLRGQTKNDAPVKSSKRTITSDIDIIDIRSNATEMDLKVEILSMLKPVKGPKKMPTLLLYDERGLQIFEKVGVYNFFSQMETHIRRSRTWMSTI